MKVPSVREKKKSWYYSDIVWLGRVALVAQRPIVVKLSRGRSVGPYVVRRSVGLVHCGKMADRIRMPFGVVGQTGTGMRQVVEFEVTVHGKGYFWGRIWGRHCNQRGLYGVRVRQRRDGALFPNYFGQTCYIWENTIYLQYLNVNIGLHYSIVFTLMWHI